MSPAERWSIPVSGKRPLVETRSIKGETFEFCHILSGVVELTQEGGEPVIYKTGDSFVMKPGFVGVWKTIETVRKIYVTVM